jgi:heat shock protein HslJ
MGQWLTEHRPRGLAVFGLATLLSTVAHSSEWQVTRVNGAPSLNGPTLSFQADGRFNGSTGCNRFNGEARFQDGALVVSRPVATTRMACPGDGSSQQEDAMIALFEGRIEATYDPLRDILRLSKGDTVLDLVALADTPLSPLPEPHAGLDRPRGEPPYVNPFGLSDDMPVRAAPDASSEVLGAAFMGQVLRNEGCDGAWCGVTTLDGTLSGWAERAGLEPSGSALRAGQGAFDATGQVPCAQGVGAPMTRCAMGVARDAGGSATVVVTKPDGITRILFFTEGAFVSADTSQAGGGFDSSATRDGDLTRVTVDAEQYEIPDSVILGG